MPSSFPPPSFPLFPIPKETRRRKEMLRLLFGFVISSAFCWRGEIFFFHVIHLLSSCIGFSRSLFLPLSPTISSFSPHLPSHPPTSPPLLLVGWVGRKEEKMVRGLGVRKKRNFNKKLNSNPIQPQQVYALPISPILQQLTHSSSSSSSSSLVSVCLCLSVFLVVVGAGWLIVVG